MSELLIDDALSIPARDGFMLASTQYGQPTQPNPEVLLINSATAVPRHFYKRFAVAMAQAGFVVLTYDYRGINGSKPQQLRGFKADARDWALLDMAGVIDWIDQQHSPSALYMVGHSIGGQVAGLIDNADKLSAMVTFSSQSGYWRLQGAEQKAVVALHTHLTLPVLSSIFGYMPWSKFGAEDLPKGVAKEWSRWCRDKAYLLGDKTLPLERYAQFKAPVLAHSFDDDKWGTAKAVDAMMRAYPNLERRHIVPKQAGLKQIGHFGYFRAPAEPLWAEIAQWLRAQSASAAA